jgi:hypothetical protein
VERWALSAVSAQSLNAIHANLTDAAVEDLIEEIIGEEIVRSLTRAK